MIKAKNQKDILKLEKGRNNKIKYELNIYIYSNYNIDNYIANYFSKCNNDAFDWEFKPIEVGFSKTKSNKLIQYFKEDYVKKDFKNVLIIPINSISDFQNTIDLDNTNILQHFHEELISEQQPFFLMIDSDENDFIKIEDNEVTLDKFMILQSSENDYEIYVDFFFTKKETEKIEDFKKLIRMKKKNLDNFEIKINEYNIYHNYYYEEENIELETFLTIFDDQNIDFFIISFISNSQNKRIIEEFEIYKRLEKNITQRKFVYYEFKKEKINNILNKYERLDTRNFNIIRKKKSPKYRLIQYTGYYNQFGDILFSDQSSYYPAKINIAVGGFIGSGKSTLINTILGEKRCQEAQGCSITNYISEYALKEYPLNFIDFPGFRAKQGNIENTTVFMNCFKEKMEQMKEINEVIHCLLFCIKFEDRLFDEKDIEMKKVFDIIIKLKIKTFFIITQSEQFDTDEFQRFKENLLNALRQLKHNKNLMNIVFGENPESQIIPIFSFKKKMKGNFVKPFGLDNLFNSLFLYFESKKIPINFKNKSEDIKKLIDEYDLLKIFGSKEKYLSGLEEKIKRELTKILFKLFLIAPKYLYSNAGEIFYECLEKTYEMIFNIYKVSIDTQSNSVNLMKTITEESITSFDYGMEDKIINKHIIDLEGEKLPLFLRIIFPIASPIYYIIGSPLIAIFRNKILKGIIVIVMKEIENGFYNYFKRIVDSFNKAIDGLNEMSNNFKKIYLNDN